ncbi:heavy metal-associated isoprenylated plant protein 35 [Capsella rubella]|nr:heavy metal-associated isoprenylated plant protein 35 [Capsella rubella]
MATEEMKPETKQIIKEDLPLPTIPSSLPLPYKLSTLKVSIHCEGCKRKVKKILTSIEGVYKVDIDVKEHKVTVLGIVSPEIMLKKLHKAGKNAELVPEIPDPVETKPDDPKEKNKNKNKKKKEEKVQITHEAEATVKPEKTEPGKCDKPVSDKTDGGENAPVKEEKKDVQEKKDSVKEEESPVPPTDSPPEDSPAPAAEKKAEVTGEAGNGKVGKKKKKKGQNSNTPHNPTGGPARTQSLPPPTTEDQDRSSNHIPTNNNPPRHDMYHYPAPNYYAPQVMYGVSYNVAQPPLSVDAASYYTPPPPYSYAYMHHNYQPYDQNAYPSRPSDSYELFSDENPSGCSVM